MGCLSMHVYQELPGGSWEILSNIHLKRIITENREAERDLRAHLTHLLHFTELDPEKKSSFDPIQACG